MKCHQLYNWITVTKFTQLMLFLCCFEVQKALLWIFESDHFVSLLKRHCAYYLNNFYILILTSADLEKNLIEQLINTKFKTVFFVHQNKKKKKSFKRINFPTVILNLQLMTFISLDFCSVGTVLKIWEQIWHVLQLFTQVWLIWLHNNFHIFVPIHI